MSTTKKKAAGRAGIPAASGPKKRTSQIKVYLRCDTLALVSKWLDSAFAADFDRNRDKLSTHLRWFCDRLIKLGTKGNTGTRRLDIDRTLACWLVSKALPVFQRIPHLLLQRSDYRAGSGVAAFAEIMTAIKVALDRGEGRPSAVDPIEAYETYERVKRTRDRAIYKAGKYRESAPARETAAKELGVSKNTLSSAAAKGRIASSAIAQAIASLPSDVELLGVLVDYEPKTEELIAGKKTR